jgi:hypothetical protein
MLIRATDPSPVEVELDESYDQEDNELDVEEASRRISTSSKQRPQDQTREEWLADNCSAEQYRAAKSGEYKPRYNDDKYQDTPVAPNALHQDEQRAQVDHPEVHTSTVIDFSTTTGLCFRYIDHHTTSTGSVVLVFETLDGQTIASSFFNVRLKNNRDKSYPSGKCGQFIPPRMGKFVRLWMLVVGRAPTRWSRVHKSMRSNFRDIIFTGNLTEETDSQGQRYYKLRDVEPLK